MTDAENTPTVPISPAETPVPEAAPTPHAAPAQEGAFPAENPPAHHQWAGHHGHFVPDWVIALVVVGVLIFGGLAFSIGWLGGSIAGHFGGHRGQMMERGYGFHHGLGGYGGGGELGRGGMMRRGGQNFREQQFDPRLRGGPGHAGWGPMRFDSGIATPPAQ